MKLPKPILRKIIFDLFQVGGYLALKYFIKECPGILRNTTLAQKQIAQLVIRNKPSNFLEICCRYNYSIPGSILINKKDPIWFMLHDKTYQYLNTSITYQNNDFTKMIMTKLPIQLTKPLTKIIIKKENLELLDWLYHNDKIPNDSLTMIKNSTREQILKWVYIKVPMKWIDKKNMLYRAAHHGMLSIIQCETEIGSMIEREIKMMNSNPNFNYTTLIIIQQALQNERHKIINWIIKYSENLGAKLHPTFLTKLINLDSIDLLVSNYVRNELLVFRCLCVYKKSRKIIIKYLDQLVKSGYKFGNTWDYWDKNVKECESSDKPIIIDRLNYYKKVEETSNIVARIIIFMYIPLCIINGIKSLIIFIVRLCCIILITPFGVLKIIGECIFWLPFTRLVIFAIFITMGVLYDMLPLIPKVIVLWILLGIPSGILIMFMSGRFVN
jgi:hypothetical protein